MLIRKIWTKWRHDVISFPFFSFIGLIYQNTQSATTCIRTVTSKIGWKGNFDKVKDNREDWQTDSGRQTLFDLQASKEFITSSTFAEMDEDQNGKVGDSTFFFSETQNRPKSFFFLPHAMRISSMRVGKICFLYIAYFQKKLSQKCKKVWKIKKITNSLLYCVLEKELEVLLHFVRAWKKEEAEVASQLSAVEASRGRNFN